MRHWAAAAAAAVPAGGASSWGLARSAAISLSHGKGHDGKAEKRKEPGIYYYARERERGKREKFKNQNFFFLFLIRPAAVRLSVFSIFSPHIAVFFVCTAGQRRQTETRKSAVRLGVS